MDLSDKDLYIDELAKKIHNANVEKGFWPNNKEERNKSEILMLIVSELSEAQEALRDEHFCRLSNEEISELFDLAKNDPDTFKITFDILIFILSLSVSRYLKIAFKIIGRLAHDLEYI